MKQTIAHMTLVVKDYDEAIDFYTNVLNFEVIEDTYQAEQNKRWLVIAPPNSSGMALLLGKASNAKQLEAVGNQSGGRVFLFLSTDDFWRDYKDLLSKGVVFEREPIETDYGRVAVFKDLYGNLWDLIEYVEGHPMLKRL